FVGAYRGTFVRTQATLTRAQELTVVIVASGTTLAGLAFLPYELATVSGLPHIWGPWLKTWLLYSYRTYAFDAADMRIRWLIVGLLVMMPFAVTVVTYRLLWSRPVVRFG